MNIRSWINAIFFHNIFKNSTWGIIVENWKKSGANSTWIFELNFSLIVPGSIFHEITVDTFEYFLSLFNVDS